MKIIDPEYTVERIVERMKEAVARGANAAKPMNLKGYELTNGIRSEDTASRKYLRYRQSISEIRAIVSRTLPSDATVIVVSRGDQELLKLNGRRAWHFPQTEEGVYAGQHPANSQEAIEQLERLRSKGGEYVLFPQTSFWWLDHYSDLRQHLENNYRMVLRNEESCAIYELRENTKKGPRTKRVKTTKKKTGKSKKP